MKLIVEMEMPTGCANCPMGDDDSRFCKAAKKYIPMLGKPSWCPIKGELVRCRECKHFVENTWECSRLCDRFGDEYSDARVYPDWFCADGEQKDLHELARSYTRASGKDGEHE